MGWNWADLLILAAVVILLFSVRRVGQLGRQLGEGISRFKSGPGRAMFPNRLNVIVFAVVGLPIFIWYISLVIGAVSRR